MTSERLDLIYPKADSLSNKILKQVGDELGLYVYMLVDPRDGVPFYIGKGTGSRFASHGFEADFAKDNLQESNKKVKKIHEIRNSGFEPQIWILRHGMKHKSEYTAVEAATIDIFHSFQISPVSDAIRLPEQNMNQLTNARREAVRGHGIRLLDDIVNEKAAPDLTVDLPLLLITLGPWIDYDSPHKIAGGKTRNGYGYKREWLSSDNRVEYFEEMGRSTCAWWRVSRDRVLREEIKYAVTVYQGVTRGIFEILHDTWEESRSEGKVVRAFDFKPIIPKSVIRDDIGDVYEAIVGEHGHRVPKKKRGDQSTFNYWPSNT